MENEQDVLFRNVITHLGGVLDSELCKNLSQEDLRNGLYILRVKAAIVEKYLDIRNEQGRGGLSAGK